MEIPFEIREFVVYRAVFTQEQTGEAGRWKWWQLQCWHRAVFGADE
jgi:hypothetical protein